MIFVRAGRSSNGRTIASEAVYLGSNPSLPALTEMVVTSESEYLGLNPSLAARSGIGELPEASEACVLDENGGVYFLEHQKIRAGAQTKIC